MTDAIRRGDAYREQLARCAQALAVARSERVLDDLEGARHREGLVIFASANMNKRFERLQERLQFLASAMDGLDSLMNDYVREVPLAPYSTISGDADGFLVWLERCRDISPEQRDHVACQHAHFGVEAAARANRPGHVRFQELLSVAPQLGPELETDARLHIHLNPIRVWAKFVTRAMLDEDTGLPADVLFYAVREDVGNAVLEPAGAALVRELASCSPVTLDDWTDLTDQADRASLAEFCLDLAERGLVAFG